MMGKFGFRLGERGDTNVVGIDGLNWEFWY